MCGRCCSIGRRHGSYRADCANDERLGDGNPIKQPTLQSVIASWLALRPRRPQARRVTRERRRLPRQPRKSRRLRSRLPSIFETAFPTSAANSLHLPGLGQRAHQLPTRCCRNGSGTCDRGQVEDRVDAGFQRSTPWGKTVAAGVHPPSEHDESGSRASGASIAGMIGV